MEERGQEKVRISNNYSSDEKKYPRKYVSNWIKSRLVIIWLLSFFYPIIFFVSDKNEEINWWENINIKIWRLVD